MSAEKIGDIKEQLKSITDSQLTQFIEAYGSDERGGVIKLVDSAKSVWTSMRRSLSAQKVSRNMSVSTHHMLIFAA